MRLPPDQILQGVLIFALSVAIGSFITLLVDRDAEGRGWSGGRSRCDFCGVTIDALSLIPIAGYAVRGGRCPACRAAIAWRYPAIELIAGLAGLSAWIVFDGLELALALILSWLLLWLALADLRTGFLPRPVSLMTAMLGLIRASSIDAVLLDAIAGGALAVALCAGAAYGFRRLRGVEGLGNGDVILAGAGGTWVGLSGVGPMIVFAGALALIWAIARGHVSRSTRLPFAPFLGAGLWMTFVLGAAYR